MFTFKWNRIELKKHFIPIFKKLCKFQTNFYIKISIFYASAFNAFVCCVDVDLILHEISFE